MSLGVEKNSSANSIDASNGRQSKSDLDVKDVKNFLLALVKLIESDNAKSEATEDRQVKKGDTLSEIAQQLKTTVSELMKVNPQIKDANKIFAGDTIKVPTGANAKSNTPSGSTGGNNSGGALTNAVDTGSAKNNVVPLNSSNTSSANTGGAKGTTDIAVNILKEFEGFQTNPTWDVNALRLGYGSDTKTNADGSIETVTKNTRVTREDADRDLARHVEAFKEKTQDQIGKDKWQALPAQAQASLTSFAYNYGSLTDGVAKAAKTGDLNKIADAVAQRAGDDNSINSRRRNKEADLIRNAGSSGVA